MNVSFNFTEWTTNRRVLNMDNDADMNLNKLNDEKYLSLVPVVVYVVVLMVIGIIGNILVLYVYNFRFKRRSANYFITTMAIFDLLGCLIVMPTQIYDLRFPYTFYSSVGCKIIRFAENITNYGSAIVLVQIAFDRYFNICKPLKILRISHVKMMCVSAVVFGVLLSIPSLVLFGITRSQTPINGTLGYDCSIDEQFKDGIFQKVYYNLLALLFVATFSLLAGFYICIWLEIKKKRRREAGEQLGTLRELSATELSGRSILNSNSEEDSNLLNVSKEHDKPVKMRKRLSSIAEAAVNKIRVTRTTVIFVAVSVAFVVSYLPGIIVMICRTLIKNLDNSTNTVEQVLLKLFSRFYFINNAINPIIYSFLNYNFRRQLKKLVIKFAFCYKKTIETTKRRKNGQNGNSNSSEY